MSAEGDVYSAGHLRYFRLGSILHTEGKHAVRSFLETYLQGKTLADFLSQNSVKLKLDNLRKRKQIWKEQYDKLYPQIGQVDIETLDISLIYLLIRCLSRTVPANDDVWTKPDPGNLSAEADVSRINDFRNRWGHPDDIELSENEYQFETKNLEMTITRLARSVGNQYIDPFKLASSIKDKMSAKFDPTPPRLEAAVSTTDSLGKEDNEEEAKKYVSTSTSPLPTRRQPPARLDRLIDPFLTKLRTRHTDGGTNQLLTCVSNINRRHSSDSTDSDEQTASGSRLVFKCIPRHRRRKYCNVRNFQTKDHSDQRYRCRLAGVARLKNGVTVVTDTNHNSVQAFNSNNDLICDAEFPNPRGVCPMSDDKVMVTLEKNNKLMIFKIGDTLHYHNEVNVSCDGWLIDVKFANGCAYVLCDKGELHIINIERSTEEILALNIKNKAESFDVAPCGDKIFVSDGNGVVCLNKLGAEIWQYRGGRSGLKTAGVISLKTRVIVAACEANKLVELEHDGTCVRKIGQGKVHNPMALCLSEKQIFATQFRGDLREDLCREIVTLRD